MVKVSAGHARAAIEVVERDQQDKLWPLFKTLLVNVIERLDELEDAHAITRKAAKMLAEENKDIRDLFQKLGVFGSSDDAPPPVAEEEAPVEFAGETPVPTVGADGTPLNAMQAATEAAMNAAAGPHPMDAPQRPVPQSRGRRSSGGPNRRSATPPPATDASNLSPDAPQEDVEAMMDQIAGPRS